MESRKCNRIGQFGLEINTKKLIVYKCFLTIEQGKIIANKFFENLALLKYVEIRAINQNHIYKEVKNKDTINSEKFSLSVYIRVYNTIDPDQIIVTQRHNHTL